MTDMPQLPEVSQSPEKRPGFFARYPAIHFLWASPLAIAGGLYFFFLAAINVCGVSGCGGGGFGVSRGDPAETALFVAFGAVVMTSPIGLIPWTKNRAARAAVMLVIAAALGGVIWVGISQ